MKLKYGYKDEDINIVVTEIEKLPFLHRIAFAASICERLLPESNIARESNLGLSSVLRQILDEVWLILNGQLIDSVKLFQLQDDCINTAPEYDDKIDSEYVLEVEFITGSICYLIDMCLQTDRSDSKALERFIVCLYSNLYSYIEYQMELSEDMAEEETDNDWSKKTFEKQNLISYNHPFILREMAKENEDLQRLKETPILTSDFLDRLKNSSHNKGKMK